MKGGVILFRGSGADARRYLESDRSRADDYYLEGGVALAEFAVMGVVPLLIPLPTAADNHQLANARAVEAAGAALVLEQRETEPVRLVTELSRMLDDVSLRGRLREALAAWHRADAASSLAAELLAEVEMARGGASVRDTAASRAEVLMA